MPIILTLKRQRQGDKKTSLATDRVGGQTRIEEALSISKATT